MQCLLVVRAITAVGQARNSVAAFLTLSFSGGNRGQENGNECHCELFVIYGRKLPALLGGT